MAENQTDTDGGTAVLEEPQYNVSVTDAGPGTKRVSVEIPQEQISNEIAKQFKDLRREAALPGFRPGRAPAKLIEKRFGTEVKEQVRRSLISGSYQQAIEKNKLQVMGEPDFGTQTDIQLPESGPLNYSFEVEVQPEITLPSLTGIAVKKPKVEVKDENVQQAMNNLLEQQGTLVPVEDRGVTAKDYITADVHLKVDGTEVAHQHDAPLVSRPARMGGIEVLDFEQQIEGTKVGETKSFPVKGPDNHPNEVVRGKDVEMSVTVKDIKKLELAELTPEFLDDLGFQDEQEIRDALREQMVERISYDVAEAQRRQVLKYLMESVNLELPSKMSAKQVERLVQRKALDLMTRGVPQDQVMAQLDQLRYGAIAEAAQELKQFFILSKIADDEKIEVSESELNGRITLIAAQRGERPEKVKGEMAKDGSLQNLLVQLREEKALDKILESAQITEVEPEQLVTPTA